MAPKLHPLVDNGVVKGEASFSGGELRCHCATDPAVVSVASNVLHNHLCGCSKCWKPAGALFSIVGVVPSTAVKVVSGGDKLAVVDESALIRRTACKACGVHLFGPVERDHAFKGLSFIHVELSPQKGWQEPQFAAFVSSIIEQGFHPKGMADVRGRFNKDLGLPTYDCLSPTLMDLIATHVGQKAGLLPAEL